MALKFKPLLALIFVSAFTMRTFAQGATTENITLKGIILDKQNNTPLAYVSVGVLNKPRGTVSNTIGHFAFNIIQENLTDTLQISIVGYTSSRVSVKDFMASSDKTIKLTTQPTQLAEVTVISSNPRTSIEVIGRQKTSKLMQVSVHNKTSVDETVGSEMGMLYNTNKKNAIVKDFHFYISANNHNFIKFRINIYSVKNDMPDTLICDKQLFATISDFNTGWTKIDLEQLHIKVDSEFIITIQWIESRMAKMGNPVTMLPVSLTPFSRKCYARIASQDKWKKMGMGLSSFVTIAY